ncbi:L-lysine 6-transaminase [Bacteroidetes/Chlorobi group bacterium ChocPot_Mid]|jgi:L-lysine 6-transaminase|nr:MAG: L-lysine 6-transaminase [Bacteroidetes/Chlorobi group bacterium ChocPot_Mid]
MLDDSKLFQYYVEPTEVLSELRKYMLADGFDFVLDLELSKGAYFIDKRTGKKYVDFFTCFASMPIGMNHPKINTDEFKDYIARVALNKPSNSDVYTCAMATFVKTFFKIAVPKEFKYAFFISGGTLAVENALKTAFDWKVRKNFKKGYKTEKGHQIIHFKQAFHGRSGYTMSLTNTDPAKTDLFPKFGWPRITNPKVTFPLEDNLSEVIKLETKAIEEIKTAFKKHKDDIAAIIIEPIQGEGGDNHFRKEFLQQLRELADENDALLIFDEVQTGLGLTGEWWAFQNFGVTPDILVFGKKMQICGIIVTDRVDEVPENVFHTSSRINSTWGGDLVDMVRSTKYLEIIEEEKMLDSVKKNGKYLIGKLQQLQKDYGKIISNVRGLGLFCAFDLPDKSSRNKFVAECFNSGLMILGCGEKSVRFRPALNISEKQINEGFKILNKVIKGLF